jgi:hypothetical protein
MDSQQSWVQNRFLERIVSLFPKEKRSGIWLTLGIWYINYFHFMRLITFGLYRRPRETQPEPTAPVVTPPAAEQKEDRRGFAPHPASQYDENLTYEEWMTETIAFFRSIGFFQPSRDLDDRQILDRLHQKREKETRDSWDRLLNNDDIEDQWIVEVKTDSGSSMEVHTDPQAFPGSIKYADYLRQQRDQALGEVRFNRKDDLVDIWIAHEDETRVCYGDLEVGAGPDSEDYVKALTKWGRISRGVFEPKQIRERWDPMDEYLYRLKISFRWKGAPHSIEIETVDEWINLAALEAINELIVDSGIQFHVYSSFDQCAYIVALTAQEKIALETKRGWKFAN